MSQLTALIPLMLPELILAIAASLLFLIATRDSVLARRIAPIISVVVLAGVFIMLLTGSDTMGRDPAGAVRVSPFSDYIKMLTCGVGVLFVLLSWPSNKTATGNGALDFGKESGEYFALLLLSLSGVLTVASANDLILVFLGIELASIPTYVMVSMSRPLPAAQEAGVKYFFLGAMAAALLLFGMSYLYGVTGTTALSEITAKMSHPVEGAHSLPSGFLMLALVMMIVGIAFKIAAVPLHFYVGDVYQGAATPVTAFLSFVPKTSGFVALIKILYAVGGETWSLPPGVVTLMWVLAALTMTVGNVLGLMQVNVKRVFAYSSIAHSGYMLVGLTALISASNTHGNHGLVEDQLVQDQALGGILFYLAAYGIMNAGAFGVLQLLPSKKDLPGTTAETYDDLAGAGRRHVGLGLAMAVACFSLIGLPFTVGFWGKLLLIWPALQQGTPSMVWLVIVTMINAAISAAYYLKIVGTMFLRPETVGGVEPTDESIEPSGRAAIRSMPITIAIVLSCSCTLLFGTITPATTVLMNRVKGGILIDRRDVNTTASADDAGR